MVTATVDNRRFTREEYERLVEQGYFHPEERIELVDGILYEMTPQNSFHATGVRGSHEALRPVFSEGYDIRSQLPLALGFDSEPEPDIAVVLGSWRDYSRSHPTSAILIVEVADSSLIHDRKRKTSLYARSGIPEYWILNLVRWCLEVYRGPKDGVYTSRTVLREGDSVSPLSRSEVSIPVASLLPPK
jgi:Uma2 family endonuclease